MSGINWELFILAGAGIVVLLAIALSLVALWMTRFHFAGYIRRNHPELWKGLVPQTPTERLVTMNFLSFDASSEMSKFRADSSDDRGDAEIGIRRKRANRILKLLVWSWVAGATWIALTCMALAIR